MNNLDFNEFMKSVDLKNVSKIEKNFNPINIAIAGSIIIFVFFFFGICSQNNNRNQEIECIEYYNAYGYKLSGCSRIIKSFEETLESD